MKAVEKLLQNNLLLDQGEFSIYQAMKSDSADIVEEIGRLRELTFRSAGEGTGKEKDLDIYDNYYVHVFAWDKDKKNIIGAYRLGLTDRIIENHGLNGLYTHTLFKYKKELFENLKPSIELGRSFVREEYQKNYAPLMLLWKGIGQFVVKNPRYRVLFGPVSINDDYTNFSQDIIKRFLENRHYNTNLARFVKPRIPFKRPFLKRGFDTKAIGRLMHDIDQVSAVVSEFEKDQKGVPILLKQYLKLNGKILGFNVDPDFSRVLDALILVDLSQTDPKILERYMGKENAAGYLSHQEGREKRLDNAL
jgi:putative hemolysin